MSILAEDAFFLREDASNLLPEDGGSGIVPFVPGGWQRTKRKGWILMGTCLHGFVQYHNDIAMAYCIIYIMVQYWWTHWWILQYITSSNSPGAMESDLADLEAQLCLAVEAEDYKDGDMSWQSWHVLCWCCDFLSHCWKADIFQNRKPVTFWLMPDLLDSLFRPRIARIVWIRWM